jgi:predicted transcriptional regulator
MGNRSRTEIVGNILNAASGGTSKTKIMYVAFKLRAIKIIPFYIDRKQSNRISGWG